MPRYRLSGLIAATYTPMLPDGGIWLDQIGPMVEHLASSQVDGLYVCGSTGEGISLTGDERKAVAAAYVSAAHQAQVPVVVQVGHGRCAWLVADHFDRTQLKRIIGC